MSETIDVTPQAPALSIEHEKVLHQYLINGGNAAQAYASVYPAANEGSAKRAASRLLSTPQARQWLDKARADVMARNGITLDALVNVLKIQALTPISEVLGDPRDIEGDKVLAVESYRAATAKTAEVTKIADRRGAVVELLDRFFPDVGKPQPSTTPGGAVTNVQINAENIMLDIRALFAKHRPG
jgi:hypothetical protein